MRLPAPIGDLKRLFWRCLASTILTSILGTSALTAQTLVFEGAGPGDHLPGAGKHVVFVSGDEEYRSEEALPMLARIVARRHGFKATVLFAIDPESGVIDPDNQNNIPGLEALRGADMMVLFTRFRELPDEQMKHIVDYLESGGPVLALRTATHAFFYQKNEESPYASWGWRSETWPGGFGQQVLGETWVAHHGKHGSESTRGVVERANADHPLLRGVEDVWGPTDVYAVEHLPEDAEVLLRGQILDGMSPDSNAVADERNDPMMPVAWVRRHRWPNGNTSRVVTTTMGAATDLLNAGLRRFLVNAVYFGAGLEVPDHANVETVGPYNPSDFGFAGAIEGRRPSDYR